VLRITFLGTGTSQGVPVIACSCPVCQSSDTRDKRLRTSVLVEDDSTCVVIDSGPDFRQQMLRHRVNRLDGLLFTHEHKDHIAGMDDIRAYNYVHGKPVEIFSTQQVYEALKREFHYAFDEIRYPGVPELNVNLITNTPFFIGSIEFRPIRVLHYLLSVFGYRIGNFTYITDAKTIPEDEMAKIEGTEYLVLNALRHEPHVSHLTLDEALHLAERIGAKMTYLTHLSHQMGLHAEIEQSLPDNVRVAYDGLVLEI
jgi:phosphoribosyl 1,2-cyclic phosphate phosphodiesterase